MEILSSIDSHDECRHLIKCGAREFFCGYIRTEWIDYFGKSNDFPSTKLGGEVVKISPNKRTWIGGNILTFEDLKKSVEEISSNGGKLFITMNGFYYPESVYPMLDKILQDLVDAKVYGVIVTDVALIKYIAKKYPELYIALSCCNQANNISSAKFFADLGVKRITFPRHISLKDMLQMAEAFPQMDFESFVVDGRCVYDDGNCKAIHNLGNFCFEHWEQEFYKDGKFETAEYEEMQKLYKAESDFRHWTRCLSASDVYGKGRWKSISCAACAVPELIKYDNIKALKITGRGMEIGTKMQLIRLVKKMIILSNNENAQLDEINMIKNTFGLPELCDNRIRCLTVI